MELFRLPLTQILKVTDCSFCLNVTNCIFLFTFQLTNRNFDYMFKQQVRRDALEGLIWGKPFKSYPELNVTNCMLSFVANCMIACYACTCKV
jgi:hypothetical protein